MMLRNHPPGLLVALFIEMFSTFGLSALVVLLAPYLEIKHGLSEEYMVWFLGSFGFLVLVNSLVGGFLADSRVGLGRTLKFGLTTTFFGFVFLMLRLPSLAFTVVSLFFIVVGTGLFDSNLRALVGNLYENAKYGHLRDSAFIIFNIGTVIGLFSGAGVTRYLRSYLLRILPFEHHDDLPHLCHQQLEGALSDPERIEEFRSLANEVSGLAVTDLDAFATHYLRAMNLGNEGSLLIATFAMLVALLTYLKFHRHLKPGYSAIRVSTEGTEGETGLTPTVNGRHDGGGDHNKNRNIRSYLTLVLVAFIALLFTIPYSNLYGHPLPGFAYSYTDNTVGPLANIFFDLRSQLGVCVAIFGVLLILRPASRVILRITGFLLINAGAAAMWVSYQTFDEANVVEIDSLEQFNTVFALLLAPVVVGIFGWLHEKGREPSTPTKIGTGMVLAAMGIAWLIVPSLSLTRPAALEHFSSPDRVSLFWVVPTYFLLVASHLLVYPVLVSLVSKVAPPHFKARAQAYWSLVSTLDGVFVFLAPILWHSLALWMIWLILAIGCLLPATVLLLVRRLLQRATEA